MSRPTDDEIQEQVDWTMDDDGNPTNRWPGMSYEEGVRYALYWILGNGDAPIDSDPRDGSDDDD